MTWLDVYLKWFELRVVSWNYKQNKILKKKTGIDVTVRSDVSNKKNCDETAQAELAKDLTSKKFIAFYYV